MRKVKQYIKILGLILILIIVDQVLKIGVIKDGQEIIPNMIKITYEINTGGAFSIGEGNIFQFIVINIIVLGLIIRFLVIQFKNMNTITKVVLSFILAGGISNFIDRIFRGFVVDYIDITQIFKFPVFNLADAYVVLGWTMLILSTIRYTFKGLKSNSNKWVTFHKNMEVRYAR